MPVEPFIPVAIPQVGEEEADAVRRVLLSGQYASGPRVKEFEAAFAEYLGVEHAVAVGTGTAALYISLKAMGIGPGDEVIVPPITFFATVSAVLYVGAVPVFADMDADDLCLSPKDARNKITDRTKAVLPVHLYGAAAKMDLFQDLARETGVDILEDCAQAHGSAFDGKKAGAWGRAGCFSFFATKHMTTGEGGLISTNDPDLARKARIIRSHGMTGRDDHEMLGFNDRMTEMEAAIGLVQLTKLEAFNKKRIKNSEYLIRRIRKLDWAEAPVPSDDRVRHTYFWCPVMVNPESGRTIEALKDHLKDHGIGFRHRYTSPLYKQPVLKKMGLDYSDICLPVAEQVAGNVIGLPNHPGLTEKELERIERVLTTF